MAGALPSNKSLRVAPDSGGAGGVSKDKSNIKGPVGKNAPKGKGGNSKGKGGKGILSQKRYGAFGGYKGASVKDAKQLVNGEIRDALMDLRKERKKIKRDSRNMVKDARTLYQRSVGDIDYVYGETDEYLNERNSAVTAAMSEGNTRSAGAYAALARQLEQGGSNVQSDLAGLGINMGQGQLEADRAFQSGMASNNAANASANFASMQSGADSIGQLLLGMNKGAQAGAQGKAIDLKADTITDARQSKFDAFNELREAGRDVKSQRGDLVRQLLQQMAETGWNQFVQKRQLGQTDRQLNQSQQQINMQRQQLKSSGGGGYSSYGVSSYSSPSYSSSSSGSSSYTPYSSSGSSSGSSGGDNTYYQDKADMIKNLLLGNG